MTSEVSISVSEHSKTPEVCPSRVFGHYLIHQKRLNIREAQVSDSGQIQELYFLVYHGKYGLDFASNPSLLKSQIVDRDHHLLLIAENPTDRRIVGSVVFSIDPENRLGKGAGVVVLPEFRGCGLATHMLQLGVSYLGEEASLVDVMYATTRTINEAPSRVVGDVGFIKMGIFPNAVQVDTMEHLTLDVYLGKNALSLRRGKPFIFFPYHEVYDIAMKRLNLEPANLITEFFPLKLNHQSISFEVMQNEPEILKHYHELLKKQKLANSFFPFHLPNLCLKSEDENTEIFAWMVGKHKQAAILGYRTDQVNLHDLLDAAAWELHRLGAAYVEFLVDAYDYKLQQQAFTARFIPSAYFPAMRLNNDGLRDDVFVLSRTFNLLDFSNSVMKGDSFLYLKAYLRRYHELYIGPILGDK